MPTSSQPEQITRTVAGITTAFVGGIALLSSVFVVPAGEVGVVTTLGRSDTQEQGWINSPSSRAHRSAIRTQVMPEFSALTKVFR